MDVWLKLTMYDFVYVFDAWRKRSCGVVCVWLRTKSDTIVGMFILFYHQEWMIYGGKLIWCDVLTSKIYQFEVTVLVSVRIFVNKLNTYRLKKMMMRTTCKAVNCYSNVARVKYLIGTSNLHLHRHLLLFYVGKFCRDFTPADSCAKWEDYMKGWNYITIDFHQEICRRRNFSWKVKAIRRGLYIYRCLEVHRTDVSNIC